MLKKILKFIALGVFIALLTAVFANRGIFMGLQKSLQNKFYDFASASPEIVLVTIDEKSLSAEELGPLPQWKRAFYAQAIETLNTEGASVVGIDMTFPDLSIHGLEDDEALKWALVKHRNTVLAARYYFEDSQRVPEWPNQILLSAEPSLGWINVSLDEDGFVRKIPVYAVFKEKTASAFSLEIGRQHLKTDLPDYRVRRDQFNFSPEITIPVMTLTDARTKQGTPFMYVNYFAEPGSFTEISMADLLKGNLKDKKGNPVFFKDKIVLIGPTAIDLQDYYLSPVSKGVRMPGVEIHANAIQTLIAKKFLRDQSGFSLWFILLSLIAVNLILFAKLRVRFAIPILLTELFGIIVAGIVSYEYRIFLNVIYPILTILFTFVGAFILRFILEQSDRRFIESAFGHYVSKSVVEQILRNPKMLELGGAKRQVTAFFSDIEGFTSISEKMEPGALVNFLNKYLSEMTSVILRHEGTLDKYEGDAIMAFWGAPIPMENHALSACKAALESQKRLIVLSQEWARQGLPPIRARIGINSGEAIAGNMGSENRFDYTIMGDSVNLASRLEGVNKQYGTFILISENTWNLVSGHFLCRELDQIRVKGKEKPVRIYELISAKSEASPEQIQLTEKFAEALELYRRKNFIAAGEKFKTIANDPPSAVFTQRCEAFSQNPPGGDWDGVYTFNVK